MVAAVEPMAKITRKFSTGELELEMEESIFPDDFLFDFAERENPNRAFLFVSKALGRHIPCSPSTMRFICHSLARQLNLDARERYVFIGMAETAIALGAGVMRACCPENALFIADTRHVFDAPLFAEFSEVHSHALRHLIYIPQSFDPSIPCNVVAVDDEATTGRTFNSLRNSLERANLNIRSFTKVAILNWSDDDSIISLQRGHWKWTQNTALPSFPPNNFPEKRPVAISKNQNWGRFGTADLNVLAWPKITCDHGDRVLVLGTGEFVWLPFLLAERLEYHTGRVKFAATTASPINLGMAIKRKVEFQDNYGEGKPNFLYNVNPDDYDKIFLCVETGSKTISPTLLEYLKKAIILEY